MESGAIPKSTRLCGGVYAYTEMAMSNMTIEQTAASVHTLTKAPAEQRTDLPRSGFIGTMPRSGTWYLSLLLRFYNALQQGKPLSVSSSGEAYMQDQVALGVEHIAVFHAICPGFERFQGPTREIWDRLKFFCDGYDIHQVFMERVRDLLDPSVNPNARIGYLYRNPLDQAVSAYYHAISSNRVDREMSVFNNPREYYLRTGLETYIKQFFTYKTVQEMYPDQIALFRYEDLKRSPRATFEKILRFLGHEPSDRICQSHIQTSLDQASVDSVRKIERTLGHALADDQKDPNGSHIKDGEIGKWKKEFRAEDVEETGAYMAAFGISMELFTLE